MSKQISTGGQPEDDLVSALYDAWWESSPNFDNLLTGVIEGNNNLDLQPIFYPTESNYNFPSLPSQQLPMSQTEGNYHLPPLPPQYPPISLTEGNYDLPPLPPQLPPMSPGGNYDLPPFPPQLPPMSSGGNYDLPPFPPQLPPIIVTEDNYHLAPLPPEHPPISSSGGNYYLPSISQQIPPQPHLMPSQQQLPPQPAPLMYYTCEPNVFSSSRCSSPIVTIVPSNQKLIVTDKKKRSAQPNSCGGIKKRGRMSCKTVEQIETLRDIIPYPPKAEAVSILADVVDYMIPLKERVEELRKEKARRQALQQSQSMTEMQSHTTTEDYERARQMKGKGILETTSSFPDEQGANGDAA